MSKKSINTIFIISQHRTGSTLLKNILDAHSEITMAFDEMNLFEPFRKNTLDKLLKRDVTTPIELINHIKGKKIYGTFWKDFNKSGINFDEFENDLKKSNSLTTQSIFNVVLNLLRKKKDSLITGIKYPLHFRKTNYLLKLFPSSKIIFLTRNPLAIIASKLNDPATLKRKQQNRLKGWIVYYFTLIYFSIEYVLSIKTFFRYKDDLLLVTYEELVENKEMVIDKICINCHIDFENNMLKASGKSSSYKSKKQKLFYSSSIKKYKDILNVFDIKLIELIAGRHYKKIQNELDTNL